MGIVKNKIFQNNIIDYKMLKNKVIVEVWIVVMVTTKVVERVKLQKLNSYKFQIMNKAVIKI
jgi:hypothetical protein